MTSRSDQLQDAGGSWAIVQGHQREVFEKADVLKRVFFTTVCGGR